jgi:hypothetical protein
MCIHVSGSWWTVSKSSASGGLVLFHAYSEAFKAVHQIRPYPSICFCSTIVCGSFVLWTISVSSLIKTNCYSEYGLIENSISGKNLLWFVIVNLCVGCYMISSQMATMLKHLGVKETFDDQKFESGNFHMWTLLEDCRQHINLRICRTMYTYKSIKRQKIGYIFFLRGKCEPNEWDTLFFNKMRFMSVNSVHYFCVLYWNNKFYYNLYWH